MPTALHDVIVLAAHDPQKDPRIDWVAHTGAGRYRVLVLGLHQAGRAGPDAETTRGYDVVRVRRSYTSVRPVLRAIRAAAASTPAKPAPPNAIPALAVPVLSGVALLAGLAMRLVGSGRQRESAGAPDSPASIAPDARKASLLGRIKRWGMRLPKPLRQVLAPVWRIHHFMTTASAQYEELLRRLPEEGDPAAPPVVIHASDLDTLFGAVAVKQHRDVRILYDAHEFFPHADPDSARWEVALWQRVERSLLTQVDAAFTVSPPLAECMSETYGCPFGALPNAEPLHARPADAPSGEPADPSSQGKPATPCRFLFQGGFAPQRGIDVLIRAWQGIDGEQAVLLLRGPESADRDRCISLARSLGVLDRSVLFPAAVHESEMIAAATQAEVGLIPYLPATLNYRYCCPNKLSQYLQAGLAVMSNDLAYPRQLIEEHGCGAVYQADQPQTIVDAVRLLSEDRARLAAIQQRSRDAAANHFNWEVLSQPLLPTYERLRQRS